jgi:hypothetical protein
MILDDVTSYTFGSLQASEDRVTTLYIGQLLLQLTVGIVFIVWTHRLYGNLPGLRWTPRFASGWAIGGWFVPMLSLWRPKQVIDDTSRGSAPLPEVPRADAPVPLIVHAWWTAFIVMGFALLAAPDTSTTEAGELRTRALILTIAEAIVTVAAILSFWVVAELTRRQIAAAGSRTAQPTPITESADHPSARRLRRAARADHPVSTVRRPDRAQHRPRSDTAVRERDLRDHHDAVIGL